MSAAVGECGSGLNYPEVRADNLDTELLTSAGVLICEEAVAKPGMGMKEEGRDDMPVKAEDGVVDAARFFHDGTMGNCGIYKEEEA